MNIEINSFIYELLIILRENFWQNICGIAITAFLKCVNNMPLILAKCLDWQNRRLYSGVILNKVKREPISCFVWKSFRYWLELAMLYLVIIMYLCICKLAAAFREIGLEIIPRAEGELVIAGVLLGSLVIVSLFRNSRNRAKILVLLLVESVLVILPISIIAVNIKQFYAIVGVITYILIVAYLYLSYTKRRNGGYNLYMIISKLSRCGVIIVVLFIYCVEQKYNPLNIASNVWGIWCTIEYIFTVLIDDRYVLDVFVFVKGQKVVVRDRILKCHDGKVKYVNAERKKVIVNLEHISKIVIENYCLTKINMNKEISKALLKDGTEKWFRGYKWIDKEWMALGIYDDSEKRTEIYHKALIEELELS